MTKNDFGRNDSGHPLKLTLVEVIFNRPKPAGSHKWFKWFGTMNCIDKYPEDLWAANTRSRRSDPCQSADASVGLICSNPTRVDQTCVCVSLIRGQGACARRESSDNQLFDT